MKLFLVHTMLFVGSIWKNKSGWFLFVMSLGLLMATELVLTAGIRRTKFQPKFCSKSSPPDITEPMKLFLVHTMLFVGSIWKNKSGWFLFVMSLGLLMATELVMSAGIHNRISTQVLLEIISLPDITEPMKLFLVHTMLFVGSIWKKKVVGSCL
jgi:hypothetical protein